MDIRLATELDIGAILGLYRQLFAANSGFSPEYYREAECGRDYPLGAISSDKADILVAVLDGEVRGLAHVDQRETPDIDCIIPHNYCFLNELTVDAACRGRGIGGALLDSVKEWTTTRGLSYIELNVFTNNPAMRLYEKHGFADITHNMRLRI